MSSTTMYQNDNNATFGQEVTSLIHDRITRTGVIAYDRNLRVGVNVTEQVRYLAKQVGFVLEARTVRVPVSDSDIERALLTIVILRCAQLNHSLPKQLNAADVPIPDFFRPFVAQLGIFEDPRRALIITPYWDAESTGEVTDGKADGTSTALSKEELDDFRDVVWRLKASGLRVTNGLPRNMSVDADNLFRIQETEEGELRVAGPDVCEVDVLVRSILRLQFLENVFGAARTRYVSVEDLRPALDAIVTTGFNFG